MKTTLIQLWIGVAGLMALHEAALAQVVLETQNLRLEIAADGHVTSLAAKPVGTEYAWTNEPMPFASVYRGGQMAVGSQEAYAEFQPPVYRGGQCFPASAVSLAGDTLTIRFAQANVTATYRVTIHPHYLAFKLLSLAGDPIDRIDLVQLRVKRLPSLGPWINVAYDDRFGICLCAGNLKTAAGMTPHSDYVEMRAVATREVTLAGATAVLFGISHGSERPLTPSLSPSGGESARRVGEGEPRGFMPGSIPDSTRRAGDTVERVPTQLKDSFLDTMEIVERDFQMPAGAKNRRAPVQQYSYLWCSPTPQDVDRYIALAQRAGFRMLLFSYTAFTQGAGHFRFNKLFPGGIADLKSVTDRIRAAGLKVGIHIHYNKADRTDPYVVPVPDERLRKVRTFTLAAAVDEKTNSILVQQNPAGCTRAEGRRILQLGPELIAYHDYTVQPPYRFTGCERGHLKTSANAHRAGAPAGLLDVDDWIKFIRFDQDADIQDEAARRLAEIVNGTGPYDLVYFDGAEDVHDPFWYHVANAQHRVYRLFDPPPPACEAAMSGHFSWHFMTRGNAYDVDGHHIKNFCREISCRTAPIRAKDFTRINFGWIFRFHPDMGPDVLEYVLSRGAAWDCPVSLRLTLAEVAAHPRADDCFDVIKTWEDARLAGKLTEAQRAMLKTQTDRRYVKVWDAVFKPEWTNVWSKATFNDQEHHLFTNERGEYELVPAREVSEMAGGLVKAYVFQRPEQANDTYVLLWARQGEMSLTLPVSSERLTVMRSFGKSVTFEKGRNSAVVPVGSRRYLRLTGIEIDQAIQILRAVK